MTQVQETTLPTGRPAPRRKVFPQRAQQLLKRHPKAAVIASIGAAALIIAGMFGAGQGQLVPWLGSGGSTTVPSGVGAGQNYQICNGTGSDAETTTSDTTNVSTFTGSQTINANTTGYGYAAFPSSGELVVGTTANEAIVSYSGKTGSTFTGVNLVSGSGTLSGWIFPYDTSTQWTGGSAAAQYLTSPWTYDALASGRQLYTVSAYEALSGYGTTLPPLPTYITNMGSSYVGAEIIAPTGAGNPIDVGMVGMNPAVYFFEGGAYGALTIDTVGGDEVIGGSAAGYSEPYFSGGNTDSGNQGIQGDQNIDAAINIGGQGGITSTLTANTSGSTVHIAVAGPATGGFMTFADGSTYRVSAGGGTTTLTVSGTPAESSGTQFWYDNQNNGNSGVMPFDEVGTGAAAGASSFTYGANGSNSYGYPIAAGAVLVIGTSTSPIAAGYETAVVSSVNYSTNTVTLDAPLGAAIAANAPIYYEGPAGGNLVQFMNLGGFSNITGGTIDAGAAWTVKDNYLHDGFTPSDSTAGEGLYMDDSGAGGNGGTAEYNCLATYGFTALHQFSDSPTFDYNEVFGSSLTGGSDNGEKWWGTRNAQIEDDAFAFDGPSGAPPIWFDNGNTGFAVIGNYFFACRAECVQNETGFEGAIEQNVFVGSGEGIVNSTNLGVVNINESGGWPPIPGSNYNGTSTGCPTGYTTGCELIENNDFSNNAGPNVVIWGSGSRNCFNPQEEQGTSPWDNSPYCSGGFPWGDNNGTIYDYPANQSSDGSVTTAASTGASSVVVSNDLAQGDTIGFSGQGADTYATSTTCTSSYASCTVTLNSATGFPSGAGQVQVGTSAVNNQGRYVGTVLDFTSQSGGVLNGVTLANANPSGSGGPGTIVTGSGGYVMALEPYTVGTCSGNAPVVTCAITPNLTANVAAGALIYNDGSCYDHGTSAALPDGPNAPDGNSYWDLCTWQDRNVVVSGNTFSASYAAVAALPAYYGPGVTAYQTCASGTQQSLGCITNDQSWQVAGSAPYSNHIYPNGMMSCGTLPSGAAGPFTGALANLNGASPWGSAPASNGEAPWCDVWSGNTYTGPWYFYAYDWGTCNAASPWLCYVPLNSSVASSTSYWEGTASGDWAQG